MTKLQVLFQDGIGNDLQPIEVNSTEEANAICKDLDRKGFDNIHVMPAEIVFETVFRMDQLKGEAYFEALRTMIDYFEWANGRSADDTYQVIQWVREEDILFYENGDMIGGDE